ncbi:MAG TPA: PspC domain-containing protein [Polyangiaceae bacterium]|nr:PspC domain-containing protein [Polyangiaceae bacterium]
MNAPETPGAEPPRSDNPPSAGASSLSAPKRLYRDPSGPVGGVAGGFAGYFDVDPVLSRLLWIVALFSGIGFPAYLVCWLVIPKAKVWPPPGYGGLAPSAVQPHQTALLSGFVILGLVAIIGTGVDGLGQYLLPAALVGVGVYLLSQRAAASATAGATPAVAVPPGAGAGHGAMSTAVAPWSDASAASTARTGLVTPTVLSVLAIGAGVFGALHAAGLVHPSFGALAAGGLVIVGGGLLASLWFGRARGLVPLGLGLVCIMLAAPKVESLVDGARGVPAEIGTYLDRDGNDGTGDVTHAPKTLDELQPQYNLGAGELTLDLSALDFSQATRDVGINVGIGEAHVIVSASAPVEVSGDVGIGEAQALGSSRSGLGASLRTNALPEGGGKLRLKVNVGIGEAEVRRAP